MDGDHRSAWDKAIEVLEEITRKLMSKVVEIKLGLDTNLSAIHTLKEDIQGDGPDPPPQPVQGPGTVKRLLILHTPDRTVAYFDDIQRPIVLRRCKLLVELLRALSDADVGDRAGADGLVPFKTQEQLIDLIDAQMGNRIEKATLRTHVLRLRNEFKEAGLDRGYIETIKGRYRLRFAIDGQVIERYQDT
jgi:hypothetical protein